MADIEVVTTGERHDLDDVARAAFHPTWPKFIFHDPIAPQYSERVEEFFPVLRRDAPRSRSCRGGSLGGPAAMERARYVVPDALDP